jgi:hypothetical protein
MTKAEHAEAAHFMNTLGVEVPMHLERGGIIGTANIVACVTKWGSPWFVGRFGFVLSEARPVEFIPCKGALGFFEWRKQMTFRQAVDHIRTIPIDWPEDPIGEMERINAEDRPE